MSGNNPLLIFGLLCCLLTQPTSATGQKEIRLLFTGDILLSRNVQVELDQRRTSPWKDLSKLFYQADMVVGNLEGAFGDPSDCPPAHKNAPCFCIPKRFIPLLASADFKVLSIENNHSHDLGENGRLATKRALQEVGITSLSFQTSPRFFHFDEVTIGVVAVNLIPGRNGACQRIPSYELRQKLRLARSLANVVVVTIHWGSELLEWPNRRQREATHWLIKHGADLIIGHHPHVIQPPEMIQGKPVFFSLGNHLFDQKYLVTKEGLIADCQIKQRKLRCGGITTHTAKKSFFPQIVESAKYGLKPIKVHESFKISGTILRPVSTIGSDKCKVSLEGKENGTVLWKSPPMPLVSIAAGRFDDREKYLFTLERRYSPIDNEIGLRPYVYRVTRRGLVARWRGSALAWPLLDAEILPDDERILCALHRGDSFIDLKPQTKAVRVAAYKWNGFGFSGVDDPTFTEKCRRCLEIEDTNQSALQR